jgi:hypothetical protein
MHKDVKKNIRKSDRGHEYVTRSNRNIPLTKPSVFDYDEDLTVDFLIEYIEKQFKKRLQNNPVINSRTIIMSIDTQIDSHFISNDVVNRTLMVYNEIGWKTSYKRVTENDRNYFNIKFSDNVT